MKIAILSHAPPGTGTYTSSHRIARHLESGGHRVDIVEYWQSDIENVRGTYDFSRVELVISTHAAQTGRAFADSSVPFVLIFSGTDLDLVVDDPHADLAVTNAHALVAYDLAHLHLALQRWPCQEGKLHHIPKGTSTEPSDFDLAAHIGRPSFFLLPSGLRPVKDVLYLADVFEQTDFVDEGIPLVIVGLPRDPTYAESVYEYERHAQNVIVLDPLKKADLHSAMGQAKVVLNSSRSESSANALLEAMHIGACVVARDTPGNRSIVSHGVNGLLYDDPSDFARIVRSVLNPDLINRLGSTASRYIRTHHRFETERDGYCRLVEEIQ